MDIEKAFDSYDKKKSLDNDLVKFVQDFQTRQQLRSDNMFLSEAEFNELVTLKTKADATVDDKKKIDDIEAKSLAMEKEYDALQQKKDATEADKSRLLDLQKQANASKDAMDKEQQAASEDFNNRRTDLSKQVMADVESVVAAVAKEKGLSMVFNKSIGEVGLVVYSSMDITDEVIKRMNKK
ncbi:MAG: OmpH/Skp family outer membrane protein [Armatimonadota bacterium]